MKVSRYRSAAVQALGSAVALLGACGAIDGSSSVDAHVDAPPPDAGGPDASLLGSPAMPAASCAELRDAIGPASGLYWLRHPDPARPAFQVYCEQVLAEGGWALLYNSVHRVDGTTTAFWNIVRDDRFKTKGSPSPDENYYQGSLYLIGTEYMDAIADLAGTTAVAAVVQSEGIDPETMKLQNPVSDEADNADIVNAHFKAGWSSPDYDGDPWAGDGVTTNCAVHYSNVTQHYSACWGYSLGSDADAPFLDGGVGPHVNNRILGALGLALQQTTGAGSYSQVKRIARFTRW